MTSTGRTSWEHDVSVWEHDMPCALEINVNGGFKRACEILLFNHLKNCLHSHIVYGHLIWSPNFVYGHIVHAYHKRLLPIELLDPSSRQGKVTWPFDHVVLQQTWQTKIIVPSLQQCLWLPNLAGWWLDLRDSVDLSHMTLKSCDPARSRDKLRLSYLYYYNAYSHQSKKLGRLVTYFEGLLPITSHGPLIIWFCKVIWQTKNISLLSNLWLPNSAGWWHIMKSSHS